MRVTQSAAAAEVAAAEAAATAAAALPLVPPPQRGSASGSSGSSEAAGGAAPGAEAQQPGRGILEKLAALKGLQHQKSSRPGSRTTQDLLRLSESGDLAPAAAAATAAPAPVAALLPQLQGSGGSLGRGPSRIQSLQSLSHHRSRLSVDGLPEQSSPGRAHLLLGRHPGPAAEAAPAAAAGGGDALASFELAALQKQQQQGFALGSSVDGLHHLRRTTATPSTTSEELGRGSAAGEAAGGMHQLGAAQLSSLSPDAGGFAIPSCPLGRVLQIQVRHAGGACGGGPCAGPAVHACL